VAGFEGWWAYPGTALVLSIDGAAEAGLPAKLTVVLEAFGAGEGGPVVTAAGQPVALAPRAEALVGEAPLALPARTWEVRIDVPAAGPMVAVRWVAIEADGQRIDLMGREAFVLPPSVNLLQRARQGEATVRSALQPVALGAFAPHPELPVGILQAPDLEPLSNGALVSQIRCPTCSPLRLREDGALLLPSSASCRSMMRERSQAGRFCQEGAELRAVGLDGGNPGRTGRAWTVEVVPSRLPPIGFWIAPGDVTDLPSPGWMLLPMRHGARTLLLGGVAVGGDPAAVLDLTLELGGEAAATLRIPAAGLRGTPVELAVDPPLPAGARPLVLRVASPGDAPFVLLTKAELRE
jgi:hypothetical protein